MTIDRTSRRQFIALAGGVAVWPFAAQAQPGKVYRVGFLGNSTAALEANLIGPFRESLRAHGYEEGRNLRIEYRWAEGNYDRFPKLIAELLALKVEVLVTAGTPPTLALKKATASVPIVMIAVGDPIGTGIVSSLARPGGNITGLSSIAPELEGKRLELLREIMPQLSHVAVLSNPTNPFHKTALQQARDAAQMLKIKVLSLGVKATEDLDGAFATIVKDRPEALLILADRVFLHDRARLMEFAAKNRLPSVNAYRELVEAGGLMSFGPSYEDMHRRAAEFVDKILKGAKPGDIPVELPTKFTLVVSLKAAKALGIAVSESFLLRADQVIE
jgi:putative tryptophan/tyrosine transport system substrate-binding protein